MNEPDLAQTLRDHGLRVTAQRLAVASVLAASTDHPTALEVYERVRKNLPHVTLATIYNTVAMLQQRGLVQPLVFSDGTRYEMNLTPHANLVCVTCGRIIDADDDDGVVDALRRRVHATFGFETVSQRLDLYGNCADCAAGRNGEQNSR